MMSIAPFWGCKSAGSEVSICKCCPVTAVGIFLSFMFLHGFFWPLLLFRCRFTQSKLVSVVVTRWLQGWAVWKRSRFCLKNTKSCFVRAALCFSLGGVRESSAVSRQKSGGGITEFEAKLGINTNSVPSFQFDCENNWINDNREECAQSMHSKHSASKEIIKNYHVYLSHSSKYVDETVVYSKMKC